MVFGRASTDGAMPTIDHLNPRWRGGTDELDNLVLAHRACNQRRNAADQPHKLEVA